MAQTVPQKLQQLKIVQIAQTCHEVNRAYCELYGDYSQESWELAPEWKKLAVMEGIQFYLNHLNATPEIMHENWARTLREKGWTLGPEKDAEKKTHPNLVPYKELSAVQQGKDKLYLAVIRSFL